MIYAPGVDVSEPTPIPAGPQGRRFELVERIGTGAFGEVYLAKLQSGAGFERKVALKLLHPSRFGEDDATKRIRDEARVLGRLHHPNIVTVLDLVRLEHQWAVVMEYVEGADLERVLKALRKAGRVFPAKAVLGMMASVSDALDAAYNADGGDGRPLRVEHRDIKPANIRVTANGDVKILDFGIARARDRRREARTGAYVIGTQRYMAPERIAGRGEGSAGDVYGLAATAFELLTGEPLGRSPVLTDRHQEWVRERLRARLPDVLRCDPATKRRIGGLLADCLDAEALNRPRAADLAEEAGRLARSLPGEDLRAFGRRFVPQVDTLLGRERDVVTGVLTELSTASTPADPAVTLRERSEDTEEAPRRGGWLLPVLAAASAVVVVGAVMLVVGLAGGVGAWWMLRSEPAAVDVEPNIETVVVPVYETVPVQPAAASEPEPEPEVVKPKARARPPAVQRSSTVSRALVRVEGADGIRVRCGGASSTGTASARIMGFPSGRCSVHAVVGGKQLDGTAIIEAPRTVTCSADGQSLTCD